MQHRAATNHPSPLHLGNWDTAAPVQLVVRRGHGCHWASGTGPAACNWTRQLLFWTFLNLLCIPLIKCMVPLWEQTKWNTQWINETKCIKMRWELPIYSASFVYVGGIAKQNRREQDLTAWRSCPGQATLGSWAGCKIAQYPPWMQTSQPLPLHLKLGIVGSCFKPHMAHVYQYSAYLIYKYVEIQVVWYKLAISHQGNSVPLYKMI